MNDYLQQQFGLKGKRALITGAARGIGRAIAEAFGAAGADVFIHYNKSESAANELVKLLERRGGKAFAAGRGSDGFFAGEETVREGSISLGFARYSGEQRRRHGRAIQDRGLLR